MIYSMTGFGRGEAEREGISATVELRSVNKRFTEVSARLPRSMAERENDVQALLKERFARGRISAQIQVEQAAEAELPIKVDTEMAKAYTELLNELRATASISEPVQLDHLLEFSDVFTSVEEEEAVGEEAWPAVKEALSDAADQLERMRRNEGKALESDLRERVANITKALTTVEERAPKRIEKARATLRDRLDEIFEDERIADDRLEAEIALLADKLDITEECVRLHSHLNQFREALSDDEPAGRKLKFLVQEIHREVNTIGSKANDAAISHQAVAMKEEIEKIREQIQNVE